MIGATSSIDRDAIVDRGPLFLERSLKECIDERLLYMMLKYRSNNRVPFFFAYYHEMLSMKNRLCISAFRAQVGA